MSDMLMYVYEPCDKHKGMSWTITSTAGFTVPIKKICPHCESDAPRAAEAGEDKELAAGVLRLTGTIRYLVGIAERGEGRSIRHDETVESFVLHYVQRLEQGRPAIIEECARVCDEGVTWTPNFPPNSQRVSNETARLLAKAIRALAPGGQNAAAQGNSVMGLDQRTVKPSDGGLMPEVPVAAAPAPAEVAEGAGRPSWDKIISDLRDVVSKLPAAPSLDETTRPKFTEIPIAKCPRCGYGENAAPSLSREEWGMLYRLLDKEIPPGVKTAEFEPWIALRAKFREQEREGKAPKC